MLIEVGEPGLKLFEQGPIAREKAEIEQADVQLNVLIVEAAAFGQRPDGLAHLQVGVPKLANEFGNRLLDAKQLGLIFDENKQIDIGVRKQLAAAVTADGRYRDRGVEAIQEDSIGGFEDEGIHIRGAGFEKLDYH